MTREDYQTSIRNVVKEECNKGKHKLKEIWRFIPNDMECEVVRRCETCGSVVIDMDFDGRTNPGAVMEMISPAITKALS